MFSFHKPRVYRSTEGCCICRAKSSSSRFTDSRKYEDDSMKCFNLKHPRHGEICNACVLLVKRFKRLPAGSTRNWGHVVDARAGPGTKSLTKSKRVKDDNEPNSRATNHTIGSRQTQNTKSLLQEKFSKIFKKTKKVKIGTVGTKKDMNKRKSNASNNSNSKSWRDNDSLPTTPDSLDSDYEDARLTMPTNGAAVQFQTQTRASSYRSRKNASTVAPTTAMRSKHKRLPKVGGRRRKCLMPRKNRNAIDNVQFFDENEWQQKKSCCGTVYESTALAGALIIDLEHYKPCPVHQRSATEKQQALAHPPKTIIATMPAVVQLAPPAVPVVNKKPTPVLKKHHLFFKRQSENFPHADINVTNYCNSNINNTNATKIVGNTNKTSSTTITAIPQNHPMPANMNLTASPVVSIFPGNASAVSSNPPNFTLSSVHLPKHSTAKITTITPTPMTNPSMGRSHNFMHKVKTTETGKIVKHSLEKINTTAAIRMKPNDLSEMKNIIKTVDKPYMLARPSVATITTVNGNHHPNQQPHISTPTASYTAGALPSLTSSSSTKFSDNSSDSGFDENIQDRKSVSPLQEDTDRKILTRPNHGVQTMFLASGVQIQGQQQNLVLTGNEVAAKILNNRKQQLQQQQPPIVTNFHQQRNRPNVNVTAPTSAVKIAQIVAGSGNGCGMSTHAKMRGIYKPIYNNNTIQHENGITTIVPASSLAATTQTAAMNAIVPSTVTITPAPHIAAAPVATTLNNFNGKKSLSGSNIIGTIGNGVNSGNVNNIHSNISNNGIVSTHLNTINNNNVNASLNQKIIVLKTAAKYNNNNANLIVNQISPINTTPIATLSSYNQNICKK